MLTVDLFVQTYWEGFKFLLPFVFGMWFLSIAKKDVSIIDIFWGAGFSLLSLFYFLKFGRVNIVPVVLTFLWGLRLSLHIGLRNRGQPEDRRYAEMRKGRKKYFVWWSLVMVFVFQGALMVLIAQPLAYVQGDSLEPNIFSVIGIGIWGIGFFFESVGDFQLVKFKANPQNKGKVLNTGLWRYTRHPNYFGDACLWFGFYFLALGSGAEWWLLFSPVIMTFFLLKVSGVSLLERDLKDRKPEYQEYMRKTSAFLPMRPKK